MRRKTGVSYAVICLLLLLAGLVVCFFFAWRSGTIEAIKCLVAILLSLAIVPIVHETGHMISAKRNAMMLLYAKFFCFKLVRYGGKLRFGFASPFSPDQTQVFPKHAVDMKKRALSYTIGGLVFSGVFALAITGFALIIFFVVKPDYFLLSFIPYAWYLFFLNAVPVQYASGKTDALIYRGIKKGEDAEKNMLSAMQIHGELFTGKSFAEIDESLYFELPVLCEDEPMFAVMLDLRYRYYLEKGDIEKAGETLNRLAYIECYLTDSERANLAIELTYMHALTGDLKNAKLSAEACWELLQADELASKRALIAYALQGDKKEEAEILIKQAETLLEKEKIKGIQKAEKTLLCRFKEE